MAGAGSEQEPRYLVVHTVAGLPRERRDGLEVDGQGVGGTGGDRGVG
jgi:hypothetical protein